jgi:hypothetical protein
MMNEIRTSSFVEYSLVLLLLFSAMAPSAIAKPKPEKPADPVTVVAHLPLAGGRVSQTFLQEHAGKEYLYIQQASDQGFTIVDVTKPYRPNVVNHVTSPNVASGDELQMVANGLAIAETPDTGTESARHELTSAKSEGTVGGSTGGSTGSSPSRFVRLLDLSDPDNPQTLRTFDAVSSILLDDGRNLIYITNGEGLWILSHNVPPPHPLCESEITDAVNCYAY